MKKNKHGDLFNTSLTEIIIILFFVLMLFALFNIDKVNKENLELGTKADILSNDIDILIGRNNNMKKIVKAINDDPSTLGPINVELTMQIADLNKEIQELEKKIERLNPEIKQQLLPEPSEIQFSKTEISGNCIDKKFWRQCADWAWPIQSNPPYEYLFDIGMCRKGDIVVIKSEWRVKREIDFDMVEGASTISDKMYISRDDIKSFISLIHNESLDFLPEQTQHTARLINLESIDTDISMRPRKTIKDHMNFEPFPRGSKKFIEIYDKFPKNSCAFFNLSNNVNVDKNESKKSNEDLVDKNIKNKNLPPIASFIWDGNIKCDKASGRTNSKFNIKFDLEITANGRVKPQDYDYEKTNRNNRLVALDLKKSISQQRKNIFPAYKDGNPVNSIIEKKYTIPANICSKY